MRAVACRCVLLLQVVQSGAWRTRNKKKKKTVTNTKFRCRDLSRSKRDCRTTLLNKQAINNNTDARPFARAPQASLFLPRVPEIANKQILSGSRRRAVSANAWVVACVASARARRVCGKLGAGWDRGVGCACAGAQACACVVSAEGTHMRSLCLAALRRAYGYASSRGGV
jgi:hypothetical protein